MPKRTDKPETTETTPEQNVQIVPKGEVVSVYSNMAQVVITPFDFALIFAQLDHGRPLGQLTASEVVRVIVSPPTGKALLRLLEKQIALYEKNHGEILDVAKPASLERVSP